MKTALGSMVIGCVLLLCGTRDLIAAFGGYALGVSTGLLICLVAVKRDLDK